MLMRTLISVLNKKVKKLDKGNIRLQFMGRREGIPLEVLKTIDAATQLTRDNTGLILNLAFNYGGRLEILDAVKNIVTDVKNNKLKIDSITEDVFNNALYTKDLPDPDLLIRTSGEKRISNFLLWQLSYAELYFTDKFWPEFDEDDFKPLKGYNAPASQTPL
jgi:undecaprenyl diphosphate synthase